MAEWVDGSGSLQPAARRVDRVHPTVHPTRSAPQHLTPLAPTLDLQERLTELETKLTFQEATSDSLSEVIVALEERLEALEKRLRLVEARGSGGSEGEEPDPLDERPPHY